MTTLVKSFRILGRAIRRQEFLKIYQKLWPYGCSCSRGGSAIFCDCNAIDVELDKRAR